MARFITKRKEIIIKKSEYKPLLARRDVNKTFCALNDKEFTLTQHSGRCLQGARRRLHSGEGKCATFSRKNERSQTVISSRRIKCGNAAKSPARYSYRKPRGRETENRAS